MTTMGVYVRDLLLGQYYFDTLFPRIPVPVLRTIVTNLENMKLPSKHCGTTGESTRGSEETARRPPSVKAALSVSFGQRAPHRASTRDSSPVRRTITPSYDRDADSRRSPNHYRSQNRDSSDREYSDRDRDRDKDREWERDSNKDRFHDRDRDHERVRDRDGDRYRGRERDRERDRRQEYDRRSRDSYGRDYDRSEHEGRRRGEGSSRHSRSRSRSRSRSQSIHERSGHDQNREKASASSNLAKLKDLYGDLNNQKEDAGKDRGPSRPIGTEEVIRLGGSTWSALYFNLSWQKMNVIQT